MKEQKRTPKLSFRNATKEEKHATCRRFLNAVAALPPEKRGTMPLPQLLQELAEAEAAGTRVSGLRAALKAAVSMSDDKTSRLCRNVTSAVELFVSEFGPNEVTLAAAVPAAAAPRKPAGPPEEPTSLRVIPMAGAVKLRWKRPLRGNMFVVESTEDASGKNGWAHDSKNITTLTSLVLNGLRPDTAYWFRVRAQNSHGEGPWSEPVTARPH